MLDFLIAKIHDPHFMTMLFAAIAVSATAYTLITPLLASDDLNKRMKAVASERERIRQRERDQRARRSSWPAIAARRPTSPFCSAAW
jgi:tight adherence protein C